MDTNKSEWTISRRDFLVKGGTVLGVGMALVSSGCSPLYKFAAENLDKREGAYKDANKYDPDVWFEINPDNTVTLYSPKVEMGQGIFTGFALMAAEELEVSPENINVVHASTEHGPVDSFSTGGSSSTSSLYVPIREIAANMRVMLVNAAAVHWKVPVSEIKANDGKLIFKDKSISYAEIVKIKDKWEIPRNPPALKSQNSFKYIGKNRARKDLSPKVMGEPIYGIDAEIPGMLYGSVLRSPYLGAKILEANITRAEKNPDVVKVIKEKDYIVVVAKTRFAAESSKRKIEVKWEVGKKMEQKELDKLITVGAGKPFVIQKTGDVKSVFKSGEFFKQEYRSPMGSHAQMEPTGAVASVVGKHAIIKIATQVPDLSRKAVAKELGIPEKNVDIQPTFIGGGFGRRLDAFNAVEVAKIAKAVGKPVHVFFERQEEFQNSYYRPPSHHVLKAKLSSEGQIEALEHDTSSGDVAFTSPLVPKIAPAILGADVGAWRGGRIFYEIPNKKVTSWRCKLPFYTSWWRGLGLLCNTFAVECFIDELAHETKKDPLEMRLEYLKSNDNRVMRIRKTLEAVAEKANWNSPVKKGIGRGIACSIDVNAPAAMVVEISMKNNEIKMEKVTCAIDPGIIINPDGVRAQCEGGIIMGISATLYEGLYLKDGQIASTNFHQYPMATIKDTPEIDVVLLENDNIPHGVGEPAIGPIGAAIGNAIFNLTGKRLRQIPLSIS